MTQPSRSRRRRAQMPEHSMSSYTRRRILSFRVWDSPQFAISCPSRGTHLPTSGFPFTFESTTDHLTGKTDGLFLKCSASNTCPNVIQVDSYTELYGAHDSLIVTDTKGKPLQLPVNVRLYLLTLAHLQGNEGW